ncbi:MAG: phosphonate ABC transporter ATP-binding protein [Ketobacteraceae bacterium]|nr:phosphonate ABC transporter ATP-binding protein [Ketobacteraceae bacterium]
MSIPPGPEPILKVHNLSITYPGDITALKSTSLDFHKGELTVLLGLSGAGKSSLLRCLNHLVVPTSGSVESVHHGVLFSAPVIRQHRRDTAMIFQHHQLLERQTALQNVLTGRLAYHSFWRSLLPLPNEDIDVATRALERVGLGEKLFTRIDQLSGGQKQRVGIARALAQQPSMILADEPVASLDPATSVKILDLLKGICIENDITAVISLHQLDFARQFADRIIGLANAAVVFDGTPKELSDHDLSRIYNNTPKSQLIKNRPSLKHQPETEMQL